ncbi:hypothetical protein SEVIR_4G046166v4 [Setaria viridis]|uniref:uncharacterized protein n=1 Tax=Setaria viridis TaxID=4556 RepID=UPI001493B5B8|nr:uncharacterized protein LOC117852761 [Setaria viridis]
MADKVRKPAAPLEVSMEKEPSSPLPVPSMDDKKQPPLLAMAVVLDVKLSPPTPASMDKKEKPPAVLFVCLWALANAISFAGNAVAMLIMNRNPCTKSTWWFRCAEVTHAAAAEATALWRGQLWCGAPQTAAAALALVLTGRGRRRSRWAVALAFLALVATAAGHYMEGRVDRIFLAAAPGDAYITADVVGSFFLVVLDLLGFLCLLIQLGDGGEE